MKSLIKQAHVRGIVLLAGARSGTPIFEYSPLEIKRAVVGYGRAEKRQVQQMVKAILKLTDLPPSDAAGYTMVKKNWFNGVNMPSIAIKELNGEIKLVKQFNFDDYVESLS